MSVWSKRVRGAIGIGIAWGAAWLGAGLVLLLIVGPHAADVPFPLFFGLLGFLSGIVFSSLLGFVAGRRRFTELSLSRFALWGAIGGAALSAVVAPIAGSVSQLVVLGPIFALAGGVCGAGTLALARKSERSLDGTSDRVDRLESTRRKN